VPDERTDDAAGAVSAATATATAAARAAVESLFQTTLWRPTRELNAGVECRLDLGATVSSPLAHARLHGA